MMTYRERFALVVAVTTLTVSAAHADITACGTRGQMERAGAVRVCLDQTRVSAAAPALRHKAFYTPMRRAAYCRVTDDRLALLASTVLEHSACASAFDY